MEFRRSSLFFFSSRRRHTRCGRDWSSDVCSSDLIVPEVREWVIERIERGTLQRIDVAVNSPVRNLSRKGPPIPDDGLAVNIVASGVTVRPVNGMPAVRDADLKARVTGRTATVTIGQGIADTPAGRKINISDFSFEVP